MVTVLPSDSEGINKTKISRPMRDSHLKVSLGCHPTSVHHPLWSLLPIKLQPHTALLSVYLQLDI